MIDSLLTASQGLMDLYVEDLDFGETPPLDDLLTLLGEPTTVSMTPLAILITIIIGDGSRVLLYSICCVQIPNTRYHQLSKDDFCNIQFSTDAFI